MSIQNIPHVKDIRQPKLKFQLKIILGLNATNFV